MTETPLDSARRSMSDAPEDDRLRLKFFERVADAELFLLLEKEAEGNQIVPRLFDTEEGRFALVFDREHRLAEFAGGISPYAALSGRSLIGMIAGQKIGIGLNLGVAPSSILLPEDAVSWLSAVLKSEPGQIEAAPQELHSPANLPPEVLGALDTKLATAVGLAKSAYLVTAMHDGRGPSHLLAFIDPLPEAASALAQAVSEALVFSGAEDLQIDVAFFASSDPLAPRLAKVGLRFDLPAAEAPLQPFAPGMDTDKPPRLK